MTKLNAIKILLALFIAGILSGCANLPPILQDHNGNYGIYLPTGKELMTAMLYRQDAKFTVAGGQTCILEHNTLNGHVRFLYPNASFNQMHGWRDIRYAGSRMLPDGQVMGLFLGTINGQPDTEELVLFHPFGISFVPLGTQGMVYVPKRITENHILFQQIHVPDPLLRVFDIPQQQMSMPVLQSAVLEREAAIRQQQAAALQEQQAAKLRAEQQEQAMRERTQQEQERVVAPRQVVAPRRVGAPLQVVAPQRPSRMAVQIISLQGGAVPVQSDVPTGHQKVLPQAVNLQ